MGSKENLIGLTQSHGSTIRAAYAFRLLAASGAMAAALRSALPLGQHEAFAETFKQFTDVEHAKHSAKEVWKAVMAAAVTTTYEALWKTCKGTELELGLHSQPWFRYLWLIRNSFNHDFLLDARPDKRKYFPIRWDGVEVTEVDLGQPLTDKWVSPDRILGLLDAVEAYVSGTL